MKKLLLIGLIIAATCSISFPLDASGFFLGGIFSSGFSLSSILNPFSTKDSKTVEKSFKIESGNNLKIDLYAGGTIKVSSWDKDELYAKVIKAGKDDEICSLDFENNSDGIKILSDYDRTKRNTIDTDMTFEIKVPRRFNINFNTAGGDILVENVKGGLTGETNGGMISLNKIKGKLSLITMGGDIELKDSEAEGSVITMGGNIAINNVKGGIKGTSMGGKVTYNNVTTRDEIKMGKEVKIMQMGGRINVDNAPDGANLTTMGGNIKVGTVKHYIKAKTMGGDIEIGEADGSVKVTTMSGDVKVKVLDNENSIDHDVKLTSMSGDITLYVPADFSMDVNIKIALPSDHSSEQKVISDFDLSIQEKESDSEWHSLGHHGSTGKLLEASGSFNGGKNHIEIITMHGNVYLKKNK